LKQPSGCPISWASIADEIAHQLRKDQNMNTKPNPKLLLDIYSGTLNGMKLVELRKLKEGEYFRRKPDAHKEYIRGHYNRKDSFGPASFCCTDSEDIGRCIQLKPSTIVYVEAY
tara:strand:- start:961 stop:1302 length:342 start_codon:yes stop_codon:yes gene_type:complete